MAQDGEGVLPRNGLYSTYGIIFRPKSAIGVILTSSLEKRPEFLTRFTEAHEENEAG